MRNVKTFFICGLLAGVLVLMPVVSAEGSQYTLRFNKSSTRMSWNQRLPSWQHSVPVGSKAAVGSAAALRISTSASLNYILDERNGEKTWQDRGLINWSIDCPILGHKMEMGLSGDVETRNATLQKQKIRDQTYSARVLYTPFEAGLLRTLRIQISPGLITGTRSSRAKLDSTIKERGTEYDAQINTEPVFELGGRELSTSLVMRKEDNTLKHNKDLVEAFSLNLRYKLLGNASAVLSVSESRTGAGVTRAVIEPTAGSAVDTMIAADVATSRNSGIASKVGFQIKRFRVDAKLGYTENVNTNTAAASGDQSTNRFFAHDHETVRWDFSTELSGKLTEGLILESTINQRLRDARFLGVQLPDGSRYRIDSEDRQDRELSLDTSLDWKVASEHRLGISSKVRAIRDKNPHAPQLDRDTYRNGFTISYARVYASGLQLKLGIGSSFYHRVNLHVSRSSDNFRNRDLNLDIDTRYQRFDTSITHNFVLSARSTIYAFARQVNPRDADRRSNIRRGWSMRHALQKRLIRNVQTSLSYAYRADDFGRYIVEDDAQIVEEDNSDHTASCGISYRPNKVVSLTSNYTYRLDRQWDHNYKDFHEFRSLVIRNQHENLSVSVDYRPTRNTTVNFRGSRSRQRSGIFDTFNVGYVRTL